MSHDDWNDDEQRASAPLPAHERAWRHPSEVGERVWVQTEPPLAIGRGLTATTGAVGGLLALAVMWTMVPTHAGRSAVATARSTIAALPDSLGVDLTGSTTDQIEATETTRGPSTSLASSSTAVVAGPPESVLSSVANSTRPLPTYAVRQSSAFAGGAVAVAVNGGNLVITTAQAVEADLSVDLLLPNGQPATARVLFVDGRSGLAVLAPDSVSTALSFSVATAMEPGDELTFFGDEEFTVVVRDDGTIDGGWADDTSIREGTPVVNQRGELVALCSHDGDSASLVSLANLDELQHAMAAYTGVAPVWVGIVLNDDPAGVLSIAAVDPAGPAAAAGLAVGDVIVSVDGRVMAEGVSLSDVLSAHLPGDVVDFEVLHADGTRATVAVTLGAPKTSL